MGDEQRAEALALEQREQLVVEALAGDLVDARRTARRTGTRRVRAPATGRARRASASRPTAAWGTCPRSRSGRRAAMLSADPPGALGLRRAPRARRTARRCGAPCATAAASRPGTRSRGWIGRRSTLPVVGGVRPDAMRSSVDLPHPEGPTTVTNSPASTANVGRVEGVRAVGERHRDAVEDEHRVARLASARLRSSRGRTRRGWCVTSDMVALSVHDHPTGDVERLAGAVVGVVRREEQGHVGHVGRLGERPSGDFADHAATISSVRVAAPISVST